MRRWLLNILATVSLALCAISVGLWIWGYRDVRYLYAKFASGHYDGDRSWSGSYLGVFRGQLFFEREGIGYTTRPTTAPNGRWAAEDTANVRTPALRSFPFDGPLGFHFVHDRAVSDVGSVRIIRLAAPLWFLLLVFSVPFMIRVVTLLRRRSPVTPTPAAAA